VLEWHSRALASIQQTIDSDLIHISHSEIMGKATHEGI
jgi:hypothetical protein